MIIEIGLGISISGSKEGDVLHGANFSSIPSRFFKENAQNYKVSAPLGLTLPPKGNRGSATDKFFEIILYHFVFL